MSDVTPYRCPRCGSEDWAKHEGFHYSHELPVKAGDKVRIRAGAEIRTTLPDPERKRFLNPRSRWVKIHDMDGGRSDMLLELNEDGSHKFKHIDGPSVCWTGTGGYWHYVKLEDVLEVKRS